MLTLKNYYKIKNEFDKIEEEKFRDYEHYIMWSGGYDSTLLTFVLLNAYKDRKILKKINIIYANNNVINDLKTEKEMEAREKILKLWKEKYDFEFNIITIKTEIYSNDVFLCNKRNGYFQQYLFLSEAAFMFSKKAIYHIPHIKGENATADRLKILMRDLDNFTEDGETIVSMPLKLMTKIDIIKSIIDIDNKLMDIIWTCETPNKVGKNIVPCYDCEKCEELYNALLYIKHEDEINNTKKLVRSVVKELNK